MGKGPTQLLQASCPLECIMTGFPLQFVRLPPYDKLVNKVLPNLRNGQKFGWKARQIEAFYASLVCFYHILQDLFDVFVHLLYHSIHLGPIGCGISKIAFEQHAQSIHHVIVKILCTIAYDGVKPYRKKMLFLMKHFSCVFVHLRKKQPLPTWQNNQWPQE